MTTPELAALLFTALNAARVLAYLPQVVRIARDRHGAEAISCFTWSLFALSHFSTVAYALIALDDARMAAIFAANLAACLLVLGLTAWKRALSPSSPLLTD
jgi:uncharacterized protein with PQ loop repeat